MRRAVSRLIAVAGLLSMLGGIAVAQDRKPDATLKLSEGSVAAGIGFSWGEGTLTYQGNFSAPLDVSLRKEGGDYVGEVFGAIAIANTIAYVSEAIDTGN